MYVDGGSGWRPSPWQPPPRRPRISKRQERVILWLIVVNALLLLVAPVGGATVIQAVIAMSAGR